MLNSCPTTVSYAVGFALKNVASTATPNERDFAAARPRNVVVTGGDIWHFACDGSCWQVLSLGTVGLVSLPPQAIAAQASTSETARDIVLSRSMPEYGVATRVARVRREMRDRGLDLVRPGEA